MLSRWSFFENREASVVELISSLIVVRSHHVNVGVVSLVSEKGHPGGTKIQGLDLDEVPKSPA